MPPVGRQLSGKPRNPFRHRFGRVTGPALLGRDEIDGDLRDSLEFAQRRAAGIAPRDLPDSYIIYGARGSGKTAMLIETADIARAEGLLVVEAQGLSGGRFGDSLASGVAQMIASTDIDLPKQKRWFDSFSLRIPSVAEWRREHRPPSEAPLADGFDLLLMLAEAASEGDNALVLCVDEMQVIDAAEMQRLSERMQTLVEKLSLPVHFIGAGLPRIWHTTLAHPRESFFRRCIDAPLAPISEGEARYGFKVYAAESGGAFDADALALAASAVEGSSYLFQLIGHHAWATSTAPDDPISVADVEHAIAVSVAEYEMKVTSETWDELNDLERTILVTLHSQLGAVTNTQVADLVAEMGHNRDHALRTLRRLGDAAMVTRAQRGSQRLYSIPAGSGLTRRFLDEVLADALTAGATPPVALNAADAPAAQLPPAQAPLEPSPTPGACGKYMRRARRYCKLTPGHAGRCRSQVRARD